MPCEDCPPVCGETKMKLDRAINLKVDDRMQDYLGRVSNKLDYTQAEFIRCYIDLAGPQVERHPDLIRLLPFYSSTASNQE